MVRKQFILTTKKTNYMKNSLLTLTCTVAVFYFGIDISAQKVKDTIGKEKKIDEVVLIGYGSARKSDLTGSVAVVSGASLDKSPVANVAEALTGKIAGLTVTTTEGSPDAEINLKVRGGTSISQDNNPLIIVDGFEVNSLNDIPSSTIENITVLKDASSTAIYGSRGANGVILVTTKAGKSGKIRVTLNGYSGFKFLAQEIDVLSPLDYAKWQYEYATLTGLQKNLDDFKKYFGDYSNINQYQNYQGIDWQKKVYGNTGTYQNTELGVSGGSSTLNFNLNLAHYNSNEIQIGSKYRKDNLSLNLKGKPNDKINFGVTFRYSNYILDGSGANEQNEASSSDSRLKNSVQYSPINVPALTTEDPNASDENYLTNPLLAIRDNDEKQVKRNYVIQGNFGWNLAKNLKFNTDAGLEYYHYNINRFYGSSTYYALNNTPTDYKTQPSVLLGTREDKRFRIANTFNYDFKNILGDDHRLKLLLGQEYTDYQRTDNTSVINGFSKSFTFENAVNLSALGHPSNVNNFVYPDDRLLSFFTRATYDYKGKYLLTATLRADGSSKFTTGNKWGYFPSAALAWKVNEENFLKDVSWINLLKFRLSYGEAGNNNIPTGQTIQNFAAGTSGLNYIDGVTSFLAAGNVLANPDLRWETTTTKNLGFDYELIKGRISGSVDAYKNNTTDLLVQFPLPGSGYLYQYQNIGEVENKGIEGNINIDAIKKQDYGLSLGFNIAFNKNKIISLGALNNFTQNSGWASTAIPDDYIVNVGQPLGLMRGYKSDGRYEVSDFNYVNGVYTLKAGIADASTIVSLKNKVQPGDMKLKDLTGDGKVDINDLTTIGNVNPKFTGGFVLNANVKSFDLSASFNFSVGNDVYNADKIAFTTGGASGQYRNLSTVMADGTRWTNIDPGTGALVTDPTALAALNANTKLWSPYSKYVFSDWAVEDGSFLRLNTLTLGYTFPESLVSKLGLTKIRLYTSAANVFVLTKYSGLDPEVSTRRKTPYTPGVDSSPYPKSRQVVFGFNLSF